MNFTFEIKDIIDVLLVAILMYQCYMWTRGTGVKNIFIGLIIFVLIWFLVTKIFEMELLGTILDAIFNVGAIALIVIFQTEIRRFFSRIGSRENWKHFLRLLEKLHLSKHQQKVNMPIEKISEACINMAKDKIGALIIIGKIADLQEYVDVGEYINAEINTRLIENIFFKNSPLHDGAMIILDNRITSAGTILPISRNRGIPKGLGLRHRAALGITEKTDAVAIVVSEETGKISIAHEGGLDLNIKPDSLSQVIENKLI
ncbi:MAG: diadenylate cyclase CdaA [Prevotellaceae bacterium]|jgi:uncharacterized protein (TIGR00159 family)|nr:diadenylate cyclase CdaA [Prevotellaceae bacterium]